jgi:anti-sigma factor RsiW
VNPEECRHLLAGLSEYLEGEAPAELCAEIDRRMADCGDCRVVVDSLRKTITLYRSLPPPPFPSEARTRLLQSPDLAVYFRSRLP